jgi:hypothetical protein
MGSAFKVIAASALRHIGLVLAVICALPQIAWGQIQYPKPTSVEGFPSATVGYVQPDGKLLVAGDFESVGGAVRNRLARLNADGSLDTSFAPEVDNSVTGICGSGDRVFVVGGYASIAGVATANFSELSISTNQFSPNRFGTGLPTGTCSVVNGVLYFIGPSRSTTNAIVRVDLSSNSLMPPLPSINGTVHTAVPVGNTLYIGGTFTLVAGVARNGFAAIDLTTLTLTSLDLGLSGNNPSVRDIKIVSNSLYLAGLFTGAGTQTRSNLLEYDLSTRTVTTWRPEPNGPVNSIDVTAAEVFATGSFSRVNATTVRGGAAAFTRTNAGATAWNPNMRLGSFGGTGNKLIRTSNGYWLLGAFGTLGADRRGAAVSVFAVGVGGRNLDTPIFSSFGVVTRSWFDGTGWWVGGRFAAIDGVVRQNLARLNLDGTVDTTVTIDASDEITGLHAIGDRLFVAGKFEEIGGVRKFCAAAIKISTKALETGWALDPGSFCILEALTSNGTDLYWGGATGSGAILRTDVNGARKPFATRFLYRDGRFWSLSALAVHGNTLFIGGSFDQIEAQQNSGLTALDATTGVVRLFSPLLENRGLTSFGPWITSISVVGDRLFVAGGFSHVNGLAIPSMTAFRLSDLSHLTTPYFAAQDGLLPTAAVASSESGREVYYCSAGLSSLSTSAGGASPRSLCAAFDAQTGARLPWRMGTSDSTSFSNAATISVGAGRVLFGGAFNQRPGNTSIKMVGAAQRPASIRVVSGSGQSATLSNNFAPLVVDLIDEAGNAIPNAYLKAVAPGSGASATFAGPNGFVITDINGRATIATRANSTAGSYTVTVITDGTSASASFSLTNTVGCGLVVGDCDGDGVPDSVEVGDGLNPQVKDNDVFAATETGARLFVKQVYRDLLGREADAGGLGFWAAEILAGRQTRASMIEQFINGGEFQANVAPMARLYFGTYLRIPDYGGLLFWTGEFQSGRRSFNDIATAFASAPEFVARYGNPTNRNYVNLLYQNIIGRAADQAGSDFWTGQLDSGVRTRGQMLAAFTESPEYKAVRAAEIFVTLQYAAMLKREPSQTEFDTLVSRLRANNLTQNTSVSTTISSTEYRGRFLP